MLNEDLICKGLSDHMLVQQVCHGNLPVIAPEHCWRRQTGVLRDYHGGSWKMALVWMEVIAKRKGDHLLQAEIQRSILLSKGNVTGTRSGRGRGNLS